MQLIRKISARTVFGEKTEIQELVFKDKNKPIPLFRVVGICTGTRHGNASDVAQEIGPTMETKTGSHARNPTDKMHNWTAMLGNFRATNLQTGELFSSGVCFLPNYVTDSVVGQLTADVPAVEFAFDISAQFDKDSATSYIYNATPLMTPAESDPIEKLTKIVNEAKKISLPSQKKSG